MTRFERIVDRIVYLCVVLMGLGFTCWLGVVVMLYIQRGALS
jgi:hypothetical protein